MNKLIIAFDPGQTTGVASCFANNDGDLIFDDVQTTTIPQDLSAVWYYLHKMYNAAARHRKDIVVVMESFRMYGGSTRSSLTHNSMYPCEVIGVIRLFCQLQNVQLTEQAPAIKRYAAALVHNPAMLQRDTEHEKDALLHLLYYYKNHQQ